MIFSWSEGPDKIYFNEVNTIPGFTPISMYPKLMICIRYELSELLTHLVMLAMEDTKEKQIDHEYSLASVEINRSIYLFYLIYFRW